MCFRELQTNRLLLKNIGHDDIAFMYKEFSTDEVNTYLYDADPIASPEEAGEWIDLFTQQEPRDQHRWVIILKAANEKIGTCGFHCWNREKSTVEIGYDLQPAYWRKGYISEALRAMIGFAKDTMQVRTITAHIAVDNIASIKAAEKAGFRKTEETYFEAFHGAEYLHCIYEMDLAGGTEAKG